MSTNTRQKAGQFCRLFAKQDALTPIDFDFADGRLTLGSSSVPLPMLDEADKAVAIYNTYSDTNASTSFEPFYMNTVMTGAGAVGGRMRVNLETNVVLGGWANAFKASVDCKTSGASTGLLAVGNFEITLPASAGGSAYTCVEHEMTCPASGYTGSSAKPSFMYFNSSGTTRTVFDDYGRFMHIDSGLTAGATHILSANSQTLKVGLGTNFGTTRYLVMSQTEDSVGLGVTGTPMALTYDGLKALSIFTTCASTDGSTSYEPVYINNVMTGAGQVGGRVRVNMETNVVLGSWANAFKASVDCKTNGASTGLLSVGCFEITLPGSAGGSAYTCVEHEMTCPASGYTGSSARASFMYFNSSGTTRTVFDDYGRFIHIDAGLTPAATHLVSANYQTLKCAFGVNFATDRYLVLSQTEDSLGLGVSGTPMACTYNGLKPLSIYTTCASTNTGTSYEPVLFNTVMTGAGQVGGRVRVNLDVSDVKLGGWSNAFKASVDYNTSGMTDGLGSAICAEMQMQGGAFTDGTYAPLELELVTPASWSGANNNKVGLIYANVSGDGTAVAHFNQYGYLMLLDGLSDTANGVFDATNVDNPDFTHALRINIGGTNYFIGLSTIVDFSA